MDQRELHILLVDDDEVDVMTVQRAFTKNKLTNTIHVAGNGIEALERLRSGAIPARRLVLLDLNMPRMNGIEMVTTVKSHEKNAALPILMLTTDGQPALIRKAKEAGARGWMVKPFNPSQLVAAVQKLAGDT